MADDPRLDDEGAESANELLFDASIRHSVWVQRYSGATANRLLEILNDADADLVRRIEGRIERLGPVDRQRLGAGLATTQRLQRLLDEIRTLNRETRQALEGELKGRLRDLRDAEIDIASRRIIEAGFGGVDIGILRPSPEVMRELVEGSVIRGQTLRQWFTKLQGDRLRRVESATRLGMVEGDTIPQIRARIQEQMRVSKRSAEALARTSVNAVSTNARDRLYRANSDIMKGVRWVSTLDGRTSLICASRDGQVYPVDSGPRPPAHVNCRSTTSPVTKSWRELSRNGALDPGRGSTNVDTLFRKRLRERGITGSEADRILRRRRASMNGDVPEALSYNEFLRRQPAGFQNDVLGPTKAKLFREGDVSLDRFVDNRTGQPFTLDELKRRESEAWARADLGDELENA